MKTNMSSIRLRVTIYTLLIFICLLLLEVGSSLILKIISKNNSEVVTSSFVFKSMNEDGSFSPKNDYVLPLQENASYKWKREEFDVDVRTNSIGLREDYEINFNQIKVAFFGDSFTFGHGVNVEDRYTNIFAKLSKKFNQSEVVSMSYKNGFQPEHYEFLIRNLTYLKPNYYVIGVYLGNDFGSDLLETNYDVENNKLELPYRLIFKEGQLRNNPERLKQPWRTLSQFSNFGSVIIKIIGRTKFRTILFSDFEGPNSPNSLELELGKTNLIDNRAMKSLKRINSLAKSREGQLIVLLIPQNFHFGNNNPHIHPSLSADLESVRSGNNLLKQVKLVCVEMEIQCIDPSSILSVDDYFVNDAHWNAKGHYKIGEHLTKSVPFKK